MMTKRNNVAVRESTDNIDDKNVVILDLDLQVK